MVNVFTSAAWYSPFRVSNTFNHRPTLFPRSTWPLARTNFRCFSTDPSADWPYPTTTSSIITHKKSSFVAYASRFPPSTNHAKSVTQFISSLTPRSAAIKRATHCMYAWRSSTIATLTSQPRGNASQSETSRLLTFGSSDGGEAGAGERLSRLLELGQYEDMIVVVFRWYGGQKLGSDRWRCISGVAKEALTLSALNSASAKEQRKERGLNTPTRKGGKKRK